MGNITEEQKIFIRNIVFSFADAETKFREETKGALEDQEASELIFNALINFVGNFIYLNCKGRESRIKNYKRFILSFNQWISQSEERAKTN